ncbi:hypothetical protein [Allorhodopirellula solitaria]|uniref:Uncharacterized protein n=1 Tax=Allorhodopirellula solitaria TaxID=2527987 RepID=A0A5C5WZ15_9BACT|nr:hypothetical protein [Allorhodopirellula solitaria]TWT55529.1 hypothetical protein CA85_48820 [Allorhodopirellula solitaria]
MKQNIEGSILWLRCSTCSIEFPVFVFSGENDWTTSGLRTRTDIEKKAIYVYAHDDDPPSGTVVELIDVDRVKSIPGESFQDFRKRAANKKDRYIYSCSNCGSGRAESVEKLEMEELENRGYELLVLIEQPPQ